MKLQRNFRSEPGSRVCLHLLDSEGMREFLSIMSFTRYAPGEVLFTQGQLSREVFFVFAGKVKLSISSSHRKRLIAGIANPGEMLGLESALTTCIHETTAETCCPTEVGSVSSSDFVSFLDRHPQMVQAAIYELCRAYKQTCNRIAHPV